MHTLLTMALPRFARGLITACLLAALHAGCANNSGKPAGADPALRQRYLDAHRTLETGNFAAAAVQLKQLADGAAEPYGSQAALELIYAYYKQADYPAARRGADQFIERHSTHPRADYVYYLRASAALRQAVQQNEVSLAQHDSALREAYALFQDISQRFPSSDFNENALHSLAFLRQQLALTHLKHAKAGLGRHDDGALSRLRAVSEEFSGTPAADEALTLLRSPKPEAAVAAPPAAQPAVSATPIAKADADVRNLPPLVEPPIAIHDPRWILQQRPERYTVELLSAEPDTVNIFVTRHRIQGGASYPATSGGARQTLIHGLYPDAASANLAAKQLSKRWGLPTPKIRRLGELQSSLNGDGALNAATR